MILRIGLVAIMLVAGATGTATAPPPAPTVVKIASFTAEPSTPVGATQHLWPARSYPVTPSDSNGHPLKSCGVSNDGEQVSTFTMNLPGKQCVVRNFKCGVLHGEWVWFNIG